MKTLFFALLLLSACAPAQPSENGQADTSTSSEQHTKPIASEKVLASNIPQSTAVIDDLQEAPTYPWLTDAYVNGNSLANTIGVPEGYRRISLAEGSFGHWLRHLPLEPANSPVKYHNGQLKSQQHLHEAVISIDIGTRDLQQCADAVMRLRAEYLYSKGQYDQIGFNFTNGDPAPFQKWQAGNKISIQSNRLVWTADGRNNSSHESFRKYMDQIFNYAGTASLSKELKSIALLSDMQVGDVFIKGGFPGHAVLVVDMAEHVTTGKKLFMVVQSYMPAQSIHVLKNFNQPALGAWYSIDECIAQGEVATPQWLFENNQLKRFK